MDIVFVINNAYVRHLGVCMLSGIYRQKPDVQITFHVLHSSITHKNQQKLTALVKNYGHEIVFYNLVKRDVSHFPLAPSYNLVSHISVDAYYKFFIPSELSKLDKVLYLDVDIVINGDLSDLWKMNLGDALAGVVLDFGIGSPHLRKLGLAADDFYFNSGVMLLNLKALRAYALEEKAVAVCRDLGEHFTYLDQDALNILLKDKCIWLSLSYNQFFEWPQLKATCAELALGEEWLSYLSQADRPKIIHYAGFFKPWHLRYFKLRRKSYLSRESYLFYLLKSPWKWRGYFLIVNSWLVYCYYWGGSLAKRRLKSLFLQIIK